MKVMRPVFILVSIWLFGFARIVFAADTSGNFFADGSVECRTFTAAMDEARKHKPGSDAYLEYTREFAMYLLGFQAGYNLAAPDTYDIFPDDKNEQALLARTEYFCRLHPEYKLSEAVVAIAKDRHAKRRRSAVERP